MNSKHFKSTFKHALIYSGANILARIAGFLMLPLYAHYLRGEGYGVVGMIDILLTIYSTLVANGVSQAMQRFYFSKETKNEKDVFVSTALICAVAILMLICLPSYFFSAQISKLLLGHTRYTQYIIIAIISFFFEVSGAVGKSYMLIQQRSVLVSSLGLVRLILGLGLNIYLIAFAHLGIYGYLISNLTCSLIFSVIFCLYVFLNVGLHLKLSDAKEILHFGVPMIPGQFCMLIKNNANKVFLRASLGLPELGAYQMAFKFTTLIGVFLVNPFFKIWSIKCFEICNKPDGPEFMARMFTYFFSLLMVISLVLTLEVPTLLRIITPEEFWVGSFTIFILILSRQLFACANYFSFGILYSKRTYLISIIQFLSMIVNILGCMLLIRPFGILGAALVPSVTYLFQSILTLRLSQRYYKIPFEWNKVVIIIISACLFLLGAETVITNNTALIMWSQKHFAPFVFRFGQWDLIHDYINDKSISLFVDNATLIFQGTLKLLFVLLFMSSLFILNILPKHLVKKVLINPKSLFKE